MLRTGMFCVGLRLAPSQTLRKTPIALVRATQVRFTPVRQASQQASKDLPSVAKNAKDEVIHIAGDFAKIISGGQTAERHGDMAKTTRKNQGHSTGMSEDFISLTSMIASRVPKHVFVMGLAGSLPYLGTTLSTLYLARQAGQASVGAIWNISPDVAAKLLEASMNIQVTYGAIILSFLGALHWGMEFAGYGGSQGYPRLWLGVAPLLVAWPTLALEPNMALVAQWFAFTALWYADMKVTTAGWTPTWFSQYRFYLSILVGGCIISTLFGLSHFTPRTDIILQRDLRELRGLGGSGVLIGQSSFPTRTLPDDAEVMTVPALDSDPGYVKLVHPHKDLSSEDEDGEAGEADTPGHNTGQAGDNHADAEQL